MSYLHPETKKELRIQDAAWNKLRRDSEARLIIAEHLKGLSIKDIITRNFIFTKDAELKIQNIINRYLKKPTAIPSV